MVNDGDVSLRILMHSLDVIRYHDGYYSQAEYVSLNSVIHKCKSSFFAVALCLVSARIPLFWVLSLRALLSCAGYLEIFVGSSLSVSRLSFLSTEVAGTKRPLAFHKQ